MTQISKAAFNTTWADSAGTFADNTSRLISEGDMRQFAQDIKDSVPFNLDASLAQITTVKITVSTAEILALNGTPKTLVSAQGAGTVIEPISVTLFLDYNSITYATNTDIVIEINGYSIGTETSGTFLSNTADRYGRMLFDMNTNTNITNQALVLRTPIGNPTAGDSPLYVYLTYRVITL